MLAFQFRNQQPVEYPILLGDQFMGVVGNLFQLFLSIKAVRACGFRVYGGHF